jgi:hypothetical protein
MGVGEILPGLCACGVLVAMLFKLDLSEAMGLYNGEERGTFLK